MIKQLNSFIFDMSADIRTRSGKTSLVGDSATGKTLLFNIIKSELDNDTIFIDYDSIDSKDILDTIAKSIETDWKDKIILIDEADDIFRTSRKLYTAVDLDDNNEYIIAGRNVLLLSMDITDIAEIAIDGKTISLKYLAD